MEETAVKEDDEYYITLPGGVKVYKDWLSKTPLKEIPKKDSK